MTTVAVLVARSAAGKGEPGMTAAPRPWPPTNQPPADYWRPQLHLWRIAFWHPAVKAGVLWGTAWAATTTLAAIRVWRAISEHDETED